VVNDSIDRATVDHCMPVFTAPDIEVKLEKISRCKNGSWWNWHGISRNFC